MVREKGINGNAVIDPIHSLAFSIQANRGVYAAPLLDKPGGAGISAIRPADTSRRGHAGVEQLHTVATRHCRKLHPPSELQQWWQRTVVLPLQARQWVGHE